MAIKGKGRTRTRQPIRAPRRGPVPVPVPFARRKGVQLTAAFIAGLLVFWGGVWLTNGLRAERASEEDSVAALRRRQAGTAWNALVREQIGTIGTFEEGRPPVILPQVREGLRQLRKAEPPEDAVADLQTAAADAKEAADRVADFDLTETVRDKGFDAAAVLRFLAARDSLVTAIGLTRQAALLGIVAADLEGKERTEVLEQAEALLAEVDTAIARFYQEHTEAMSSSGIRQAPSLPVS
jgi:hypothetical protein